MRRCSSKLDNRIIVWTYNFRAITVVWLNISVGVFLVLARACMFVWRVEHFELSQRTQYMVYIQCVHLLPFCFGSLQHFLLITHIYVMCFGFSTTCLTENTLQVCKVCQSNWVWAQFDVWPNSANVGIIVMQPYWPRFSSAQTYNHNTCICRS